MVLAALRAAMIPGQILAGSSPLLAIRYQIAVVFMLAADPYLTAAHQLRRDLQ